jgi:hypothetical protein
MEDSKPIVTEQTAEMSNVSNAETTKESRHGGTAVRSRRSEITAAANAIVTDVAMTRC